MSGANGQPWEFIIIKDQETKQKIAELHLKSRAEQYFIEQTRTDGLRHNNMLAPHTKFPGYIDAPVLIIVCGDRRAFQASILSGVFIGSGGTLDGTYQKSIANATYGLQLAAAALGLGSQWATVTTELEQWLKPLLGIPAILQIHSIVPVGYRASEPKTAYRRKPEEFVHYEKYDMSKYRTGEQIVEYLRELRKRT